MIGYIYKLYSPQTGDVYIGSTTTTLQERLRTHLCHPERTSAKNILKQEDVAIELIEEVSFNNRSELLLAEGNHIKVNKCVNQNMPLRKYNEYYEEVLKDRMRNNREQLNEYKRQWRKSNPEKTAEDAKRFREKRIEKNKEYAKMYRSTIFFCECGSTVCLSHKARHLKSSKHLQKN